MSDLTYQPDDQGVMRAQHPCCGERPPGRAGEPLVLACKLCPRSPTYWRRDALDPEETDRA